MSNPRPSGSILDDFLHLAGLCTPRSARMITVTSRQLSCSDSALMICGLARSGPTAADRTTARRRRRERVVGSVSWIVSGCVVGRVGRLGQFAGRQVDPLILVDLGEIEHEHEERDQLNVTSIIGVMSISAVMVRYACEILHRLSRGCDTAMLDSLATASFGPTFWNRLIKSFADDAHFEHQPGNAVAQDVEGRDRPESPATGRPAW